MRFLILAKNIILSAIVAYFITIALGAIPFGVSVLLIDPPRQFERRSVEASNLRVVAQASLIFASDNRDCLPTATDLPDYARQLANQAGLNDATIWIPVGTDVPAGAGTILTPDKALPSSERALNPAFSKLRHLFAVPLNGITTNMPGTTPIGWTRGLDPETGRWRGDSPYSGEGGHIAFLNGDVQFHRDLTENGGALRRFSDGKPTRSLREALPPGTRIADPTPWTIEPESDFARWLFMMKIKPAPVVRTVLGDLMLFWMICLFAFWIHKIFLSLEKRPPPLTPKSWIKVGLITTPVILLVLSVIYRV